MPWTCAIKWSGSIYTQTKMKGQSSLELALEREERMTLLLIFLNIWFWHIQLFWWMILILLDNLLEILILAIRKLLVLTYLGVCNNINILYAYGSIRAIPTYRVYQLYDIIVYNVMPTLEMLLIEGDVFILDCACFSCFNHYGWWYFYNFQECLWHNSCFSVSAYNIILCCSLASHEDRLGSQTLIDKHATCMHVHV